MIPRLIRFSLSNRAMIVAAATVLLVLGVYTTRSMSVDVFPDLTAPTVTVLAEAHGMAPTEVETLVTFPIETAMNGASGVRRVRSSSAMGIAVVWVEFNWGTDIRAARQTVSEKLALLEGSFPPQVDPPVIGPQTSIMGEVMIVALSSERHSPFEVRSVADTALRRRLLAVNGVAQVTPIGGDVKQYQVVLAPSRLQAYQISTGEVAEALRASNENAAAGILVEGGQEFLIQGLGRIQRLENIADAIVATRNEVPIRVGQLGEVQIGPALKRGEGSAMGQPAVVLAITKQPHVNTLELTGRLGEALDEIQATLPPGMHIQRDIFRQADFIQSSIRNIEEALRDGGILVVVIVVLFLGNLRASAITLMAIPFSLATCVIVLKGMGASLNTMTIGGMAIAIGALVDDAIVDVENVFRRLRENAGLPQDRRRHPISIVYRATVEIRSSIVFATLIVALVFLPLFFLPGVEGRLLAPLGVAYIVSLFASLVVAVTITPALCSLLLPRSKAILRPREASVTRLLKRLYKPLLDRILGHPHAVGAVALSLVAATLFYVPFMGRSFLPEFNEGALTIQANTLPGTSLAESDRLAAEIESVLMQHPEVLAVARQTGRAELSEHAQGVEASELTVSLDMARAARDGHPVRTKEELLDALRRDFSTIPGLNVELGQPISHRIDHMLSGTRAAIAVKIFAPESDPASLPRLRELAGRVREQMAGVPGVVDLAAEQQVEVPILRIVFDREAIRQHGLRIREVAEEVERAFAGQVVSQVLEGRNAFDLVVRLSKPGDFDELDVHRLPVSTSSGAKVPMRALAAIRRDRGPNTTSRENVQRKIVVSCNVSGRDVGSVVADIGRRVAANVPFGEGNYRGYYVEYGGQFESARSASRLLLILGIGVVGCIGLLLHAAFHSARDALLVMLNLPLALIGGILGVYVTGGVVSVASLVGFITLLGIATRNGIMLVSHIRHLQRYEGVDEFRAAVQRGSVERLAPILMTALSTGLGLLPLALSGGRPGNEIQTPLAVVVLFGLLSSTLLNMIVVPSLLLRWGNPTPPEVASEVEAALAPEPMLEIPQPSRA